MHKSFWSSVIHLMNFQTCWLITFVRHTSCNHLQPIEGEEKGKKRKKAGRIILIHECVNSCLAGNRALLFCHGAHAAEMSNTLRVRGVSGIFMRRGASHQHTWRGTSEEHLQLDGPEPMARLLEEVGDIPVI